MHSTARGSDTLIGLAADPIVATMSAIEKLLQRTVAAETEADSCGTPYEPSCRRFTHMQDPVVHACLHARDTERERR